MLGRVEARVEVGSGKLREELSSEQSGVTVFTVAHSG